MEQLKKCPFCDGEAHFTDGYPRLHRPCKNGIGIECNECGLIFGWDCDYGGTFETEADAATAWNRRAPQQSEQTDKPDQGGEDNSNV